jgi:Asp-tRNA(Asn)/Glu-tRNA(Gln) amidotransferase A subunit family amidase
MRQGDDGLTVSLQLLGSRGSDGALLALAEAVERVITFPSGVSPDTIA